LDSPAFLVCPVKQLPINVSGSKIVHDHSKLLVIFVRENVLHKSRFAGAKKARQQCNRYYLLRLVLESAFGDTHSLLPPISQMYHISPAEIEEILYLLFSPFSDLIQIWPLCVVAYRATPPSCAYRDKNGLTMGLEPEPTRVHFFGFEYRG
jgi:hypothetical protein